MTREMMIRWLEQATLVEPYADDAVLVGICQEAADMLRTSAQAFEWKKNRENMASNLLTEDDLK